MRKFGSKNDWWDWFLILLIVAGGTLALWTGVWIAHSHAAVAGPALIETAAPR